MSTKLCGLYARVSTERQSEVRDGSLDTQESRLKSYINYRNSSGKDTKWQIVDNYREEGKSGKNMDRPELQRLLNDIKSCKIDTVIITKLDRITRSLIDFFKLNGVFKEYNVEFISLEENFDTSTPMGKAMLNITLIFAELEREQTSKRTKDKMAWRAEQGLWNGGQVLGYDLVDGQLKINKEESKFLKLMFKKYLEIENIQALVDYLNNKGYRTKKYKSNRKGIVRGGKKFYITNVKQKLTNPLYVGQISYKDKTFKGKHNQIIDMETWNKVQKKIELKSPKRTKQKKIHTYILQGLVKCGYCDSYMTPKYSTGRSRLHPYYQCTKNSRYGKSDCKMKYAPAEALEKFVIDQLKIIANDKAQIDKIVSEANKDTDKIIKALVKEKRALEKKLPPINDQLENILSAIGKGVNKVATINKKIYDLEEEKTKLELSIENIGFDITKLQSKVLNAKIMHQSLKKFTEISDTADPENLKRQLSQFVEKIAFTPTEIKITLFEQEVQRRLFVNHPENGAPDGSEWLPTIDSEHYKRHLSKCKEIHILVKMYRRRGRGTSISLYDPLPSLPQKPKPVYKNIIAMAVKVSEYLESNPQRTYTSTGNYFGVTRARISQLMTIMEKLPDDFIEKMGECKDQNLIKRFSGKTLLKIAGINTPEQRKSRIDTIIKNL